MSIKQNGGVFGRNPTFNDLTIEGDLILNGEIFTGLDFQGSWNASTNSPSLASSTGTNGEFYIVSVAGTTNLNGITNWGIGDWAIFNGTAWQRVEGGADGNFDALTANSLTVSSTNPTITIEDSDATSTYNKTEFQNANGGLNLNTRQSNGTFVSTDYQMGKNASGAIEHKWNTNGQEALKLDSSQNVSIPSGTLGIGDTPVSNFAVTANLGYRSQAALPNFTLVETDSSNQTWQINSTGAVLALRDMSRASDRLTIDTAGNVSIPSGDLTIASGNGVFLGGTGTANKLDDYEEGTWTLAIIGENGGSVDTGTGYYKKIGNFVYCAAYINQTIDLTSLSGIVGFSLPFTGTSWHGGGSVVYANSFFSGTSEADTFIGTRTIGSRARLVKGSSTSWISVSDIETASGSKTFMFEHSYQI